MSTTVYAPKVPSMTDTRESTDMVGRFLNATEQTKAALERKYNMPFTGLGGAIRYASDKRHPVVTNHKGALTVLADLRNVIQHGNVNNGMPIATPREDAVEAMEQLSEFIERPPQIKDYMIKAPSVLAPGSSLQEAADAVVRFNFSQMPVYGGKTVKPRF